MSAVIIQLNLHQAVEQIAQKVISTFQALINEADWLSSSSREYAKKKLDKIIINLGHPQTWKKYKNLQAGWADPISAQLEISKFNTEQIFDLLSKSPNRKNFYRGAQAMNGWADRCLLNISFTAAYLQPPHYNPQADIASNLGTLGSAIAHELLHHFDEIGFKYDKEGYLNPWLLPKEAATFKKMSETLIKQANQHQIMAGVYMNGRQVVNELLADLGGLEIVVAIVNREYKNLRERKQALRRLFIGYAFVNIDYESLESRLELAKAGRHPDSIFRVNGILPHITEFYEAFNINSKDKLYLPPKARVKLWSFCD